MFKTPYLWAAFIVTAGLQLFAVYVPFMRKVLKTVPLTGTMWLFVLAGAVAPIIIIQMVALVKVAIGKPYRD